MHHSYYANVREATDINITIYHQQLNEMGKAVSVEHRLHVKQSNLSTLQEVQVRKKGNFHLNINHSDEDSGEI